MDKASEAMLYQGKAIHLDQGMPISNMRDKTKLECMMESLHSQQDETHRLIDQMTHKLVPFLRDLDVKETDNKGHAIAAHGVPLLDQLQQRIDAQRELNERLAELTHRITD